MFLRNTSFVALIVSSGVCEIDLKQEAKIDPSAFDHCY